MRLEDAKPGMKVRIDSFISTRGVIMGTSNDEVAVFVEDGPLKGEVHFFPPVNLMEIP